MIRRLQVKFIAAFMVIMALVALLLGGVVYYQKKVSLNTTA